MILSSCRPLNDKSGLGYNKTDRRNSTKHAFMYSNMLVLVLDYEKSLNSIFIEIQILL